MERLQPIAPRVTQHGGDGIPSEPDEGNDEDAAAAEGAASGAARPAADGGSGPDAGEKAWSLEDSYAAASRLARRVEEMRERREGRLSAPARTAPTAVHWADPDPTEVSCEGVEPDADCYESAEPVRRVCVAKFTSNEG